MMEQLARVAEQLLNELLKQVGAKHGGKSISAPLSIRSKAHTAPHR